MSGSQLFNKAIPISIINNFITKNCIKYKKNYILNKVVFKRLKLFGKIKEFLAIIEPYYYASKKEYITRKNTYKNFITIIRQICKSLFIPMQTKVKYVRSSYELEYYLYLDGVTNK